MATNINTFLSVIGVEELNTQKGKATVVILVGKDGERLRVSATICQKTSVKGCQIHYTIAEFEKEH